MTKRFWSLLAAALVAAATTTQAANVAPPMLVKSPPPSFFGYPQGSGIYFGINGALATGKASGVTAATTAANAGALVTQQGEVGLTVGYTWAASGAPVWFGAEGTFDLSNINAGAAPLSGLSLGGPADFEQIGIIGVPVGALNSLGLIPGLSNINFPTLPTLPAGTSAGPGNIYLFLGSYEQDVSQNFFPGASGLGAVGKEWLIGLTTGVGTRWLLSNSTALDVRFEYRAPTQGFCVGVLKDQSCAGLGSAFGVRTAILW